MNAKGKGRLMEIGNIVKRSQSQDEAGCHAQNCSKPFKIFFSPEPLGQLP